MDESIVLDAYDSGSMITYEEVDVDEIELSGVDVLIERERSYFHFLLRLILLINS